MIILCFTAFFVAGIRIYKDYGVMPDDEIERKSSVIAFNSLFPYSCEGEACPDGTDINTWKDRYYGTFLQQWTVLFEYLHHYQIDLQTVFRIRHLWIFLNVFVSQIFFFFLLKNRFKSAWAGLLGVLLFIFSPRLFGNSFYNIKDMLFYAWFVISLFFMMNLLERPNIWNALLLGITSAISVNTRIIGAVVPAFAFFFLLQDGILKKISWKKVVSALVFLCLSAGFFWVLITPLAWHDPLKCMIETLHTFSNFTRMKDFPLMYMGKYYSSSNLPWHYLPIWIFISIPILDLLLSLWGIITYFSHLKNISWNPADQFDCSGIMMLILIPVYIIIKRPVIYDAWRHFFFLFAWIVYFCLYGAENLMHKKILPVKIALYCSCLLSFSITGMWMIQNHPYEGTYFNPLVRHWALSGFERDYWFLSSKESLDFITHYSSAEQISIWDNGSATSYVFYSLNAYNRSRINSISYGAGGKPMDFLISSSYRTLDDKKTYPFYKPVHFVMMDGFRLETVFERDHSDELQAYDVVKEIQSNISPELTGAVYDRDPQTGWTTGRPQKSGDYLEIYLNQSTDLYGITLFWEGHDGEYAHSLAIDASNDGGKTWQPAEITDSNRTDFAFKPLTADVLRLHLTEGDEHPWYINHLWLYGK